MDVNGDGKTDLVRIWNNAGYAYAQISVSTGVFPDLLTTITTGLNAQTTLTYKPLTDNSVYSKDPDSSVAYPVKNVQDPLYVVSAVSTSNGLGGLNTASYSYTGMKEHQTGRGNLGFHTMTVSVTVPDGAATTTSTSTTTYRQDFPYIGAPLSSTATVKGVVVSESSNVWANARTAPDVPYVASGVVIGREVNTGLEVSRTTTTNSAPDAYGNNTNTTVATSDGFTTVTANTFYKDSANWPQSVLVKSEITSTVPAAFSDTGLSYSQKRTSLFTYQMGVGTLNYQLKDHVVQPAIGFVADGTSMTPTYTLAADTLVTTTGYDLTYGYPNSVTVSGTGLVSRSTSTAINFSTNTTTTTNALLQTESQTIDPKFGVPLSGTGPNGLVTTWSYDGFGRRVKETRNDGTSSTTDLTDCGTNPGCAIGTDPDSGATRYARYSSTAHAKNTSGTDMTPSVTVYYDILGREMRSETQGLNSTPIYKDTIYDTYGSVKKASRPYFSGATAYWTTPTYDVVGRVKKVTGPDGGVTDTTYSGFTTTVTAPSSNDLKIRKRTEVKNSQGQVVTVQDRLGTDDSYSTITYRYDAFGNLGKVTTTGKDLKTSTTTSSYDLRGRKISMKDPDMGAWIYTYNVLGELLTQKDAKLQTTTMTYDKLGRMLTRVEAEGTSTWTYDTALHGIGKLASVKNSTTGTYSFERINYYDAYGRHYGQDTWIGGVLYTMNINFDNYTGRVSNIQFPTTVAGLGNFAFYNNYTNGFLTSVSSLANNGGTKFWTLPTTGIDAEGRVLNETLGNLTTTQRKYDNLTGLLTDIDTTGPLGTVQNSNYSYYSGVPNLKTRDSLVTGANYTETFTYDELNRVLSANITGGASKAFTYDSLGNMLTKTGVGTYTYGSATVRPHAVTKVTGTLNGVVAPAYVYDNNGNLTSGAGRTLSYTSFNLPKSVTLGTASQSYYYDPEHVRFAMTEGTANKTVYLNPRWDAGTHFEKETKGAIDEYKHFIYAGGKPVAMYVVKRDNTAKINSTYTRYLHTDHLGSVDVITKEDGSVAERLGYDAWGKRRNAIGTDSATQLTSNITHHGYTGHEMADSVGLINMNGRWYDPTLGRMMQADPLVQAPESLQSYNRYSYVMNNPLSYTDPTGFAPFWSKRKLAFITRDILKDVANSKIYLGGKTYRVGGVLALGLLTTNPYFAGAYAWSTGDAKTVRKANEVGAVIVLSVWAGQWAEAVYDLTAVTLYTGTMYVAENAAIGYVSSYATSRIYGASVRDASHGARQSAMIAALMASLRVASTAYKEYEQMQLAKTIYSEGVPTVAFKFGGGGTLIVGPVGGSLKTYFSIDTNGNMCLESERCVGATGLFGELSIDGSVDIGTSPLAPGESASAGVFVEGGSVTTFTAAITTDTSGNISFAKGGWGVGGGVAAGVKGCLITTICY